MYSTDHSQDAQLSLPAMGLWARLGRAIQRNPKVIVCIQWSVVGIYLFLLLAPLLVPEPDQNTPFFQNLHLFARFAFWGFGWPFIMLSMMLFGRVWCGIFCPDGTLTETISRYGKKRSIPRWIRWNGWPFVMLGTTAIYAQLFSAYYIHPATLLLLGIPTLVALLTGFLYGNGRRIWCMYLCPANGVFSLLAKISPLHFHVDANKWKEYSGPPQRVNCAPLVNIQQMKSASACHACFRCSGYRNAVDLATRAPDSEILNSQTVPRAEAFMLLFGVIGLCTAALTWPKNPWFLSLHHWISQWFSASGIESTDNSPWSLIASHSQAGFSISILIFIVFGSLFSGLLVLALIWSATKIAADAQLPWQKLAMGLIPIAGTGLFLGLSIVTTTLLASSGFRLSWIPIGRSILLTAGSLFSIWLGVRLIMSRITLRHIIALIIYALPVMLLHLLWAQQFQT